MSEQKIERVSQQELLHDFGKLANFDKVRIWSGQWCLWWRAKGAGYTANRAEAGIYEANDAWAYVRKCGPDKRIVLVAVKAEEADQSEIVSAVDALLGRVGISHNDAFIYHPDSEIEGEAIRLLVQARAALLRRLTP